MNNITATLVPSAVGVGMGLLYFGGLAFTLKALRHSRHPARLSALSFLARTAATALGLVLLARGGMWENVITGLAGFMLVRMLLTRRVPVQREDEETAEGRG